MPRDDLPVRIVEHRVTVRAIGPPPAPSPGRLPVAYVSAIAISGMSSAVGTRFSSRSGTGLFSLAGCCRSHARRHPGIATGYLQGGHEALSSVGPLHTAMTRCERVIIDR